MTPGMKPSVRNMFEASEVAAAKAKQSNNPAPKGLSRKPGKYPGKNFGMNPRKIRE